MVPSNWIYESKFRYLRPRNVLQIQKCIFWEALCVKMHDFCVNAIPDNSKGERSKEKTKQRTKPWICCQIRTFIWLFWLLCRQYLRVLDTRVNRDACERANSIRIHYVWTRKFSNPQQKNCESKIFGYVWMVLKVLKSESEQNPMSLFTVGQIWNISPQSCRFSRTFLWCICLIATGRTHFRFLWLVSPILICNVHFFINAVGKLTVQYFI